MDDFINVSAEKLLYFKKNVLTKKHATEFLQNLCLKNDTEKIQNELKKYLTKDETNLEEKNKFISEFVQKYDKVKLLKNVTQTSKTHQLSALINTKSTISENISSVKPQKENFMKKKVDYGNEDSFPTIENAELVNRKKKYQILEHHFKNKLDEKIKLCNCMSSKHPLVGNCLDCGKIQCLQEGEKYCIICGSEIPLKEEYEKNCMNDIEMKKAYIHKEKLIKFQKDFYSKLQIIDDFTDWYELSTNTWIDQASREKARQKDDELDKIRENPNYDWSINFQTLKIEKVYEKVDEAKEREDVAQYFINEIKERDKKKKQELSSTLNCRMSTIKAIEEFSLLTKKYKQDNENSINPSSLAKKIDMDMDKRFGEQISNANKELLSSMDLMTENDYFLNETDKGKCLSMHQPWASLVIEGIKRFEGREWDIDYRGILWIHSTSKKPDQELIDSVEKQYKILYEKCKKPPKFPKRYPTSALLGCVDLVDVIKRQDYVKIMNNTVIQEKSDSNYQFVVKNPQKLDIPIKMPGQPKLWELDFDSFQRIKDSVKYKVNTFWWPPAGLNLNLIEFPFILILSPEIVQPKQLTKIPEKVKIINKLLQNEDPNSLLLMKNLISKEKKENILNYCEAYRKEMSFQNDYLIEPFLQYALYKNYLGEENYPDIIYNLFKEINEYLEKEKKIKNGLELINITVEYIDWYGIQNFRTIENETKLIKIIIGNSIAMSFLNNFDDISGKSLKLECGDIIIIDGGFIYSIPQVFYQNLKKTKIKQGTIIISYICK